MGQFVDIIPAQRWVTEESWFQGTADAVYLSLDNMLGQVHEYLPFIDPHPLSFTRITSATPQDHQLSHLSHDLPNHPVPLVQQEHPPLRAPPKV